MEQGTNDFFKQSDNFFASLMRFRKQLFIITLSAAIISGIISVILPKKYKASTILFSSLTNNASRSLLDQTYESKDYIAFGDDKNSEQMMQVIKSSDVMYGMAKRFNLYRNLGLLNGKDTAWDADYKLRGYYYDNIEFEMTEYQSIKISVLDIHPHNAYEMANGIVHIADSVYRSIVRQRAMATFNIVKHQYDSSKAVLKTLEDSMDYYRKQGVLSYDFQVKELTKGYSDAELKGNPADIKAIQDKLNTFADYGRGYWDLYNALSDQYKWMLQVKQAYMEAKTNMDKVIPPFFVAERASLPDKGTFPIRWIIVTISTLAAFFFGLAFLLIYEKVKLSPKAAPLSQGTMNQQGKPSNP
jgi:capsular polysaccharide biosynthesis protein